MPGMKNLVRHNTTIPTWIPAVLGVAALALLSIKVLTTGSAVSRQRQRGAGDPDHDSGARSGDSGGGDGGDDSGAGGQAASADTDTGGGSFGGSPVDVGADETGEGDEEDYVVLTAEEVGFSRRLNFTGATWDVMSGLH